MCAYVQQEMSTFTKLSQVVLKYSYFIALFNSIDVLFSSEREQFPFVTENAFRVVPQKVWTVS